MFGLGNQQTSSATKDSCRLGLNERDLGSFVMVIERHHASFGLGNDLLGDDQYISIGQGVVASTLVEHLGQQQCQVSSRRNFTDALDGEDRERGRLNHREVPR